MTVLRPDLDHLWSPPGPDQHCARCFLPAAEWMTSRSRRNCTPATDRAQLVNLDEIRAATDKTVADLDDTGYCPYRDGSGFPCELASGHDGLHLVID